MNIVILSLLFVVAGMSGFALSYYQPEYTESRSDWGGDADRCFSYVYVDYGYMRQKYKTNLCQV